jgi:hypothetical protein
MRRSVFRISIGNVIGVVEEPAKLNHSRPLRNQYTVKIGVIEAGAEILATDVEMVIRKLQKFVLTL